MVTLFDDAAGELEQAIEARPPGVTIRGAYFGRVPWRCAYRADLEWEDVMKTVSLRLVLS